jgi:hypothetical protein
MNKLPKDKGKQPVLDRSKANDMNMAVLKRIDPQLEEVSALCDGRRLGVLLVFMGVCSTCVPPRSSLTVPSDWVAVADPYYRWACVPVPHVR